MPEKEIAIIGSTEAVKPFLALGVQTYETHDPEQALKVLRQLEQEQKVGVIFLAESLAEALLGDIEEIKKKELPAVFILPEYGSEARLGLKRLEKTMARAIGKKL
jgi:vacuolar-type H+-ATPase subunit F/Vma7